MLAPDDHDHLGALSHDLPCSYCGHSPHRFLPCDRDCGCAHAEQIGIDTALGG